MALAFYMDEHVPAPITVGLRVRGIAALTAQEDGRAGMDDAILLDRARELGRIMVSFDTDMLRIVHRRQQQGELFASLVFIHPTRISVGECIRELEIIAQGGLAADRVNQIIYLPW